MKRDDYLSAIAQATSLDQQVVAVEALDAFDKQRTASVNQGRESDLSARIVTATLTPVRTHERSTIDTDWLGDFTPRTSGMHHHAAIAEASLWFTSLHPMVRADREEFGIQAEGFAAIEASQYGTEAPQVREAMLAYLGHLYSREAASGLDQVQQTVDPHEDPKTTPLNPEVFDNYAPPVDPINAGVVGTETSERNPLLQQIEQEGGGQGQPEKPGGHSTGDDFSNSYSEVPILDTPLDAAHHGSVTGPSPAIAYGGYTLDDFIAFKAQGASGLNEVEQVVNPHEDPDPEPLPQEVAFPWMIGPDAYGNSQQANVKDASKTAGDIYDGDDGDCSKCHSPNYGRNQQGDAVCKNCGHVDGKEWTKDAAKTANVRPKEGAGRHAAQAPGNRRDDMPLTFGEHLDDRVKREDPAFAAQNKAAWEAAHPQDDERKESSRRQANRKQAATPVNDADHAVLDAAWRKSFNDLKAAGLEADADHPIAAAYRDASQAVNHANRSRDFPISTGQSTATRKRAASDAARQHLIDQHGYSADDLEAMEQERRQRGDTHTSDQMLDHEHTVHHTTVDMGDDDDWTPHQHTSTRKQATRKQADMFGDPHPNVDADLSVANNPGTTPNPQAGYNEGKQDAVKGDAPTFADASSGARPNVQQYARGYVDGQEQRPQPTREDVPSLSAAGRKTSSRFVIEASRDDADFRKGYGFAASWTAGKPLVRTGSMSFESGLFAGIADNPGQQEAWGAAHRRKGRADEAFAQRIATHDAYAGHLYDQGIDISVTAATTDILDTLSPSASPDPGGSTFINGPGTAPPLAGQGDPAAPGGASPYNGAEPFGKPVVPSGPPQRAPGANPTIDTTLGGPVDQHVNPASLAFRRRVQASLLATSKKG